MLLALLATPDAGAARRHGPARAIDADSVELAGVEMRLHGIDAPEWGQRCQRDGHAYDCGATARDALVALLARGAVTCHWRERDSYGR
ncbi:MAG: thermonuclease family protein, partial [Gammaproteobacteria bacterium]